MEVKRNYLSGEKYKWLKFKEENYLNDLHSCKFNASVKLFWSKLNISHYPVIYVYLAGD